MVVTNGVVMLGKGTAGVEPSTVTVFTAVTVETVTYDVPSTGGVYVYKVDMVQVVKGEPSAPVMMYVISTSDTVGAGGVNEISVPPDVMVAVGTCQCV